MTGTPAESIAQSLAWLIDNSDGVVGLRADGELMAWDEVVDLYVPWMSAASLVHELTEQREGQ